MRSKRGFTLLEVMFAVGILAVAFTIILGSDETAMFYAARYNTYTTASLLMRGVVMDIEAEYQEDGFPENSVEGKNCEVPKDFEDDFDCEYDLVRLELDPAALSAMAEQAMASFLGQGGVGGAPGGDEGDEEDEDGEEGKGGKGGSRAKGDRAAGDAPENDFNLDLGSLAGQPGMSGLANLSTTGFDPTQLLVLSALFGPDGQTIMDMCNINIDQAIMNFTNMAAFFPMIVEQAANVTRKLNVRLTWKHAATAERSLEISTFIVGLPEEEMQKLDAVEKAGEAMGELDALGSPDGGVPPGSGRGGGGGGRGRGGGGDEGGGK